MERIAEQVARLIRAGRAEEATSCIIEITRNINRLVFEV